MFCCHSKHKETITSIPPVPYRIRFCISDDHSIWRTTVGAQTYLLFEMVHFSWETERQKAQRKLHRKTTKCHPICIQCTSFRVQHDQSIFLSRKAILSIFLHQFRLRFFSVFFSVVSSFRFAFVGARSAILIFVCRFFSLRARFQKSTFLRLQKSILHTYSLSISFIRERTANLTLYSLFILAWLCYCCRHRKHKDFEWCHNCFVIQRFVAWHRISIIILIFSSPFYSWLLCSSLRRLFVWLSLYFFHLVFAPSEEKKTHHRCRRIVSFRQIHIFSCAVFSWQTLT